MGDENIVLTKDEIIELIHLELKKSTKELIVLIEAELKKNTKRIFEELITEVLKKGTSEPIDSSDCKE